MRRFSFTSDGTVNYITNQEKIEPKDNEGDNKKGIRRIENSYPYVRTDLVKIILLALLIITTQVILKLAHVQTLLGR